LTPFRRTTHRRTRRRRLRSAGIASPPTGRSDRPRFAIPGAAPAAQERRNRVPPDGAVGSPPIRASWGGGGSGAPDRHHPDGRGRIAPDSRFLGRRRRRRRAGIASPRRGGRIAPDSRFLGRRRRRRRAGIASPPTGRSDRPRFAPPGAAPAAQARRTAIIPTGGVGSPPIRASWGGAGGPGRRRADRRGKTHPPAAPQRRPPQQRPMRCNPRRSGASG